MRKNRDKEVTARRASIARLYLQGHTGAEIAPMVKVSESQVSRDLGAVCERWRETALQDIGERKAQDLAELTQIKRELWSAWHLSKKRKADPRYLAEVLKALKQTAELLGYHHTTKVAINYENLTDEQLDHIIQSIITTHESNTTESESES